MRKKGESRGMKLLQWLQDKKEVEKVLITDNIKNINSFFRKINRNGEDIFHVQVVKITDIAKEQIMQNFATQGEIRKVKIVTETTCVFLVDSLLKKQNPTTFFIPRESMCEKTAREVLMIMDQIRMGEQTDEYKKSIDKKVQQIQQLIKEYEKLLEEQELYDSCRLIKEAIKIMESQQDEKQTLQFGCCCFGEWTALEKKFLRIYTNYYEEISFLGEAKRMLSCHFFKSYGIINEINYVIRKIQQEKIPFGQVNLLYFSVEYETFLRGLLSEQQIPHHFIARYPVTSLPSIRIVLDLLQWAESGYLYEKLDPVVRNPVFKIDVEKQNSVLSVLQHGIAAGIGWGVDRYLGTKNWQLAKERTKQEIPSSFIVCLQRLAFIFQRYQETDVSVGALFSELLEFIKKYQRKHKEWGVEKGVFRDALQCFQCLEEKMPLQDAVVWLQRYFEQATYQEEENQDAVNVIYFQGMRVLERKYQYVIGLSDAHFQVDMTESPVLSDGELERYLDSKQGTIKVAKNREILRRKQLRDSLMTVENEAKIFLGYSFYDTLHLQEQSPSRVFLSLLEDTGTSEKEVEKIKCYHGIAEEGVRVRELEVWERDEEECTNIPTKSKPKELRCSFSPSAMEKLLTCPLQYYYKYIRKLPEVQYATCNPSSWLPANEKGNLVHAVLQEYVDKELSQKTDIAPKINEKLWQEVWKSNVEKMKVLCACVSEKVLERECQEIETLVKEHVQSIHTECSNQEKPWRVFCCEKEIKTGKLFVQRQYEDTMVTIGLEGKIDRIDTYEDRSGVCHLRIVDYKTGRFQNLEDKIEREKTIQHIMYAMIVNKIIENGINNKIMKEGMVQLDEFIYEFVLEKEEDKKRIILKGEVLNNWRDTVDKKIEKVLVQNRFEKVDEKICEYCKYQDICGEKTFHIG